jgi:hypothetical protein
MWAALQFLTVTVILVLPKLPPVSRTTAVNVYLPFETDVVFHGMVTGPDADVVSLPMVVPSTAKVKVLASPRVPSTHSTAQAAPLMSAPLLG